MKDVNRSANDSSERNNRKYYMYGSAVPKSIDMPTDNAMPNRAKNTVPKKKKPELKPLDNDKSKKAASVRRINHLPRISFKSLCFSIIVFGLTIISFVNFVHLRSERTIIKKQVESMEIRLENLIADNYEHKNYIESHIDIEEIKNTAFNLGMRFPKEGQIVKYENNGADYMREVNEDL